MDGFCAVWPFILADRPILQLDQFVPAGCDQIHAQPLSICSFGYMDCFFLLRSMVSQC